MDSKMVVFVEKYENEQTGEAVDGVTILLDGQLKQVIDVLIQKEGASATYPEMVRDLLFAGIDVYISKHKS